MEKLSQTSQENQGPKGYASHPDSPAMASLRIQVGWDNLLYAWRLGLVEPHEARKMIARMESAQGR